MNTQRCISVRDLRGLSLLLLAFLSIGLCGRCGSAEPAALFEVSRLDTMLMRAKRAEIVVSYSHLTGRRGDADRKVVEMHHDFALESEEDVQSLCRQVVNHRKNLRREPVFHYLMTKDVAYLTLYKHPTDDVPMAQITFTDGLGIYKHEGGVYIFQTPEKSFFLACINLYPDRLKEITNLTTSPQKPVPANK